MNRRSYLSAAAGTVAGIALLQPISAAPDQGDSHRRGEAEVDLSVHHVEEKEHVSYFEDPENVTEGVGDAYLEQKHDEDLAEEHGVVRFAAAMSGDEPVRYITRSFQRFGEMRCRYAAAGEAAAHVESQLDYPTGGGSSSKVEDGTSHAVVTVTTEEGDDLSLEDVAGVTPKSVTASYKIDGEAYETEVPIYATVYSRADVVLDDGENFTAGGLDPDDMEVGDDVAESNSSERTDPEDDSENDGTEESDENDGTDESNANDENADDANDGSDDLGPGFGVAGAVAGVGGLSALARRRLGGED